MTFGGEKSLLSAIAMLITEHLRGVAWLLLYQLSTASSYRPESFEPYNNRNMFMRQPTNKQCSTEVGSSFTWLKVLLFSGW